MFAGDAALEVLTVDNDGVIRCLNATTGAPVWERKLPARVNWATTSIAAKDINNDGVIELITGDAEGTVVCLRGDGDLVWQYQGQHAFTRCPAVGDLDGDGFDEILIGGTEISLICLSHTGKELWRVGEGLLGSSPVIWDLDGDGQQEIVSAIGEDLGVVDSQGNILWQHPLTRGDSDTSMGIDSAISIADADGNNVPEIYAVGLNGKLVCRAPDGALLWEANVGGRARRSPAIGDIDGDGVIEILVAGYSMSIHVFEPGGKLQEKISVGSEINATPTIVDLTGDGRPCVVCPSEATGMPAYQWPEAKANPVVLWPEYRLNGARTAALDIPAKQPVVSIASFDNGDCYTGSNTFHVEVSNPGERMLTLELTVTQDGQAPLSASMSSSDTALKESVPYSISGRNPASLTFSCVVKEDDTVLITRNDSVYLEPFRKELADAERQIAELKALLPELIDPAGVDAQLALFETRLPDVREKVIPRSSNVGCRARITSGCIDQPLSRVRSVARQSPGCRSRT